MITTIKNTNGDTVALIVSSRDMEKAVIFATVEAEASHIETAAEILRTQSNGYVCAMLESKSVFDFLLANGWKESYPVYTLEKKL